MVLFLRIEFSAGTHRSTGPPLPWKSTSISLRAALADAIGLPGFPCDHSRDQAQHHISRPARKSYRRTELSVNCRG